MRSNHGKPVCANAPLHFNHSHSQKNYALAFGFDAQTPLKNTQFYNAKPDLGANLGAGVGVDVEDLDRAVNFSALANSRFSDDERKRWQANGTAAAWFAIWCAKEAVLKAHGLGIRLNLRELNTHAAADDMAGFAQHARIGRFYYRCFSVNHAMLAVAHRDEKTLWDLVWV
ncbi:hypothetical protein B0181_02440 [Moraxella caviae]|nr:hypothetical protein B0181_02440 [Moraxella caviae]